MYIFLYLLQLLINIYRLRDVPVAAVIVFMVFIRSVYRPESDQHPLSFGVSFSTNFFLLYIFCVRADAERFLILIRT